MTSWKNPRPLPKEERPKALANARQHRVKRALGGKQAQARTKRRQTTPLDHDAVIAAADAAEVTIGDIWDVASWRRGGAPYG